ncbi:MAG: efflux RND transporter periplasmic adaptor subunit [Gammaproteobacteria bacterium]|nr:efflux RND transporter periplasmic adaptor subunit [Gammaproteobacteria bacterium]
MTWFGFHLSLPISAVVALLIAADPSSADDRLRPAEFKVPAEFARALGIRTERLGQRADTVKPTYPARVTLPASAEQVVSSPMAGIVEQVFVEPYQAVAPGESLVRLASPQLGQLQLALLQCVSREKLARQTAGRDRDLFGEHITPRRRLEESEAALREAIAATAEARAALRLSGMAAVSIERVAAFGRPEDSIVLTALRAGVVSEVAVKAGQRVDAATALIRLIQPNAVVLDIQIPLSETARWPSGTNISVTGLGLTGHTVSASPAVSAESQMLTLRAVLDGGTDLPRPGEIVTVEAAIDAAPDDKDIPLPALAHYDGQAYVFVRTPDGFAARKVAVRASAGQTVRVQGSFGAEDEIAVSGIVALKGAWLGAQGGE